MNKKTLNKKTLAVIQSNHIPRKGHSDNISLDNDVVAYKDIRHTQNPWHSRQQTRAFGLSAREVLFILIGVILTVYLFGMVYHNLIYRDYSADFVMDHREAVRYAKDGYHTHSYMMYIAAVATVYKYSGDIYWSAWIVTVSSYGLAFLVFYGYLRDTIGQPTSWLQNTAIWGGVFACLFFAPLCFHEFFNRFSEEESYTYIMSTNWYHNSTINMIRPFSVLLFLITTRLIFAEQTHRQRIGWTITGFIISLLATQAKPSYSIVILPAIGVYLVADLLKNRHINWWVVGGICVPLSAMLFYQKWSYSDLKGILFSPLAFYKWYATPPIIILHFLLSFVFPFYVLVTYWRQVSQTPTLRFAWVGFVIGIFYTYFLAESTENDNGNYAWSGDVAGLIILVTSLGFFIRYRFTHSFTTRVAQLRYLGAWGILSLHLVSGVLVYNYYLQTTISFCDTVRFC